MNRNLWAFVFFVGLLGVIFGGFMGRYAVPEAFEWWDAWTAWGRKPDYSKPWSPASCSSIASTIRVGEFARRGGVRKAYFMEYVAARLDEDDEEAMEALGEVSGAWDRGETAGAFHARCMKMYLEKLQEPKPKGVTL